MVALIKLSDRAHLAQTPTSLAAPTPVDRLQRVYEGCQPASVIEHGTESGSSPAA